MLLATSTAFFLHLTRDEEAEVLRPIQISSPALKAHQTREAALLNEGKELDSVLLDCVFALCNLDENPGYQIPSDHVIHQYLDLNIYQQERFLYNSLLYLYRRYPEELARTRTNIEQHKQEAVDTIKQNLQRAFIQKLHEHLKQWDDLEQKGILGTLSDLSGQSVASSDFSRKKVAKIVHILALQNTEDFMANYRLLGFPFFEELLAPKKDYSEIAAFFEEKIAPVPCPVIFIKKKTLSDKAHIVSAHFPQIKGQSDEKTIGAE